MRVQERDGAVGIRHALGLWVMRGILWSTGSRLALMIPEPPLPALRWKRVLDRQQSISLNPVYTEMRTKLS